MALGLLITEDDESKMYVFFCEALLRWKFAAAEVFVILNATRN